MAAILDFDYKKLRLAQDLPKNVIDKVALFLLKDSVDGTYIEPGINEISAYLNGLAKRNRVRHYRLKGEHTDVYLFNGSEVLGDLEITESEPHIMPKVIRVQCFDDRVSYEDEIPLEISTIPELYKIPYTTFNSGTSIYFLCQSGKVVYVGQAENVHSRVIEHRKDKKFDSIFYIRVAANRLNKVETSLISYLQPEYNVRIGKITNEKETMAKSILKILEDEPSI